VRACTRDKVETSTPEHYRVSMFTEAFLLLGSCFSVPCPAFTGLSQIIMMTLAITIHCDKKIVLRGFVHGLLLNSGTEVD
jgi:hypothetical protein